MHHWELIGGLLKRVAIYDVNNFRHFIIVQKLIYILQEFLNEDFGYKFSWYLYGPYSSQLAIDFYKLENTKKFPDVKFKSQIRENNFNEFLTAIAEYKYDRIVLEVTASIKYFINDFKPINKNELMILIKNYKPYFNDEIYEKAYKLYNELKGIKN